MRASPLNQETDTSNFSDNKSIARSKVDENFDDPITNQLFTIFTTNIEKETQANRATNRLSATNAEKQAKLPNKIFNYIHTAKCRRLFLLDWYDDVTYAASEEGLIKALPNPYCNGSSFQSSNPEFLNRPPFIDTTPVKYNESNREWIAIRTAKLKE